MNKLLTMMAVVLVLLTGCADKTPTTDDLLALGFEMDSEEDSTRATFTFTTSNPHFEITTGYDSGIDDYTFSAESADYEIEYRISHDSGIYPRTCQLNGDRIVLSYNAEDASVKCDETQQKAIMDEFNAMAKDAGAEDQLDAAISYFEFRANQELPV